jgi:hypothetical protein
MRRNVFIASIVMLVLGIIGRIYANNYSYVDEAGMLHDSAWLPIGTLLIIISVFILLVLGVLSVISYFENRQKQIDDIS